MTTRVSDEVWQQLDPWAGRLSRRTTLRLWLAAVVALGLVAAGGVLWRIGLVVPRLTWPDGLSELRTDADRTVLVNFDVLNDGQFPVTVLDVGRSAPGLQLLRVEGGVVDAPNPAPVFPVRLEPHTGIGAVLVYSVTSCQGSPKGSWPVTARVQRPWGTMTVEVPEPDHRDPWQEDVVDTVCHQPAQPR